MEYSLYPSQDPGAWVCVILIASAKIPERTGSIMFMASVKILEREGRILLTAAAEIPEREGSVSSSSYHG